MNSSYQQVKPPARRGKTGAMLGLGVAFLAGALALPSSASALDASGCTFDNSVVPTTWELQGDCTALSQINLPEGVTLEGNGYTISAGFAKTDNSNISVVGIAADNVTVKDVTIDGAAGMALHGVNIYTSEGVYVTDTTIKNNDGAGLVVNGSLVTVENLTTSGNGVGVNVDLGSGVVGPAVLTVEGVSHHADLVHLYVDDTTKNVDVVDVNNQYSVETGVYRPNDAVYTLNPVVVAPVVTNKAECNNGNWANVRKANGAEFNNQGQCVSYVTVSDNAKFKR